MENASVEKIVMGNKEFLKVVPKYSDMIINYELLMITGNKIPDFLEVSRRQNNDEVALLYDITDKKSLKSILENRKLKKQELIKLIEAIVRADSNGRAYQLANKGIVIDPEYIFVSKDKPDISLLYLPFFEEDEKPDKFNRMLKDIIMNGQIENSNDGFVGSLIDVLNKDDFSYDLLEKFLKNPSRINQSANVRTRPQQPQNRETAANPRQEQVRERPAVNIPPADPVRPPVKPPAGIKQNVQISQPTPKAEKKKRNGSSGKNIIFILAVGVVVVILGLLYTQGVFVQDGQLKIEYLGAAALAGGAGLFILYRELFINSKKKEKGDAETEAIDTTPKKKAPPFKQANNGSSVKMPPSKPAPPPKPMTAAKSEPEKKKEPKRSKNILPEKPAVPTGIPRPVKPEQYEPQVYNGPISYVEDEFDDNSDTVVIDDNMGGSSAYLEYFDNGISSKLFIDGNSIVVGKQKSRVNYSIPNNTVSKVHAEFGLDSEGYYVKDYASTNGTFINDGNRLVPHKAYYIQNGDIIRLAKVELIFHC